MKRWFRFGRLVSILVIISILNFTFFFEYANAFSKEKETFTSKPNKTLQAFTKKRFEISELRTMNSKTFLEPDGKTFTTEQFIEPIHYKKKWTLVGD